MTITFISRFDESYIKFFGVIGTIMFLLGLSLFTFIGGNKLYAILFDIRSQNIANMSGFYIINLYDY